MIMHKMNSIKNILVVTLLFVSGCSGLQSFPLQAHKGDTITLAVGSPDGMTRQNTTVRYIPDTGTEVDLSPNIRAILKISPDPLSKGILFDTGAISALTSSSAHASWQSVIVIDLPNTLEPGSGVIEISSPAEYGVSQTNINDVQIPFTILSGNGQANSFDYLAGIMGTRQGDLSQLEPASQIVVRPPLPYVELTDYTKYAAVEIKVNASLLDAGMQYLPNQDIRVVHEDMGFWDLDAQLQMSWNRQGDQITVYFISPRGQMYFFQPRFAIAVKPGSIVMDTPKPFIEYVKYFDIDGNEVSGPALTASIELN